MNRIKRMMATALLLTTLTGYSQVTDKQTMINKVFETLKNKDEEGFVRLFPDAAIMKEFVGKIIAGKAPNEQAGEAMMQAFMEKMNDSSLQKEFRREFRKALRKGEEAGVDWSRSTLVSFTADSTRESEDDMEVSKLSGKIYFSSGNKAYFLLFDDIIWFENRGWYGVDIKRVDGKDKENEPVANDWEELGTDSVMVDTAVAAPAEPAPKAEKGKPKPKVKPAAKSKTSTPARKPE